MRYKDAGVDIDRAEVFKNRLKGLVRKTYSKSVLTDIGLFGGLFSFDGRGLKKPVLVSSIDGVGTKTKIACMMNQHENIGYDVVSHGVNDILAQGARPLFFLDYIGTGKINNDICIQLINGMTRACKETGCSLIGGETAQMPDVYTEGEYDLVGCIIGVVDKNRIIDGRNIKAGDILIGIPSKGLHTNGYTLARKALLGRYNVNDYIPELKMTIGRALLMPHRNYLKEVISLSVKAEIKGIAHITGGGFIDNIPRILPDKTGVVINKGSWDVPEIFSLIQKEGNVPQDDMYRTFNMGIGMVLFVNNKDADKSIRCIKDGIIIGEVIKGKGVKING